MPRVETNQTQFTSEAKLIALGMPRDPDEQRKQIAEMANRARRLDTTQFNLSAIFGNQQ